MYRVWARGRNCANHEKELCGQVTGLRSCAGQERELVLVAGGRPMPQHMAMWVAIKPFAIEDHMGMLLATKPFSNCPTDGHIPMQAYMPMYGHVQIVWRWP